MLTEIDDATMYFEQEIFRRMITTANIIRKIEKNPIPAKINGIKKTLLVNNMKKQKK